MYFHGYRAAIFNNQGILAQPIEFNDKALRLIKLMRIMRYTNIHNRKHHKYKCLYRNNENVENCP